MIRRLLALCLACAAVALWSEPTHAASLVGSEINLRGQLHKSGLPASGLFDVEFVLYEDAIAGVPLQQSALTAVQVTDGVFAVPVDFGASAFDGLAKFVELRVRESGTSTYSVLQPRTPIRVVPYAATALNVAGGVVAPGQACAANHGVIGFNGHGAVICAELPPVIPTPQSCPSGAAFGGVSAIGEFACVPTGTVTSVTAGPGLTGGASSGPATLAVDAAYVQRRVSAGCVAGAAIRSIGEDGTVICEPIGDVSAVSAGLGLTGGGTTGELELAIDPDVTQQRVSSACGAGHAIREIGRDGTVACSPIPTSIQCPIGSVVTGIATNGSIECAAIDRPPTITEHYRPISNSITSSAIGIVGGEPLIAAKVGQIVTLHRCSNAACSALRQVGSLLFDVSRLRVLGRSDGSFLLVGKVGLNVSVASCDDTSCATPTIRVLHQGGSYTNGHTGIGFVHGSAALLPDGNLFVMARKLDSFRGVYRHCLDARCTSLSGESQLPIDNPSTPVVAVHDDGRIMIAAGKNTGGTLYTCSDAACTSRSTASLPAGVAWEVLIPADGAPVVLIQDYDTPTLRFSRCSTPACGTTSTTVLLAASDTGSSTISGVSGFVTSTGVPAAVIATPFGGPGWLIGACTDADCSTASVSHLREWPDTSPAVVSLPDGHALMTGVRVVNSTNRILTVRCWTAACQ